MKRARVVRVLVIDGPVEWVKETMGRNAVMGLNTTFVLGDDRAVYERSVRCEEYESFEPLGVEARKQAVREAKGITS